MVPVRNSWVSATTVSWSPKNGKWSSPGSSRNVAAGSRSAMYLLARTSRHAVPGPVQHQRRAPGRRRARPRMSTGPIARISSSDSGRAGGRVPVGRPPPARGGVGRIRRREVVQELLGVQRARPDRVDELRPFLGGRAPGVVVVAQGRGVRRRRSPPPSSAPDGWPRTAGPAGRPGDSRRRRSRSEPTAVMTARTSSIQSSKACPVGPRSDIPLPVRSKRISREKDASRCRKSANAGFSHISARWLGQPNRKTRSSGPSPSTW